MEKEMQLIEKKINKIKTTIVKTDKFKTISFRMIFAGKFTKENASSRTLLSMILANSSKKYNNKKKLSDKMCDLYDASISVNCGRYYEASIISFTLDIVNEKNILNAHNLTKKAIDFLFEIVFNPNVENNAFLEKEFLEEKNILLETIKKSYNNKYRYSLRKMIEIMCENEVAGINTLGTIEDVNKITVDSLYLEYKKMIEEDDLSIWVAGDVDEKLIFKKVKEISYNNNVNELNTYSKVTIPVNKVKEAKEVQKITQSKLVLGYRTNIDNSSDMFYHLVLFNYMFGGLSISDLFRVIREENNLAYDIASKEIAESRIFVVMVGLDRKNCEVAKEIIANELLRYKEGNIDTELLEIAKETLKSDLEQTFDNPYDILSFLEDNYFLKTKKTIDETINDIDKITIEDIKNVALGIDLDTVFLLTNEE